MRGGERVMTLEEATLLALHVRKAKEVAGMYMSVPYSQLQLVDALIALVDVTGERPASRDEYNHIVRQLTAANARLAKWEKQKT